MDASSTASPLDGKRVLSEFARRLLHCDDPFQDTSDLLAVRVVADKDPHGAISDFNAALAAAHRRSTLSESDVNAIFSKALDQTFYQLVMSRLLLHDQREDTNLLTMQQWTLRRPPDAGHFIPDDGDPLTNLRDMVLELNKQVTVLTTKTADGSRGFTPRAEKLKNELSRKIHFAAGPLKEGGNWSQSVSNKVAFHKGTGREGSNCDGWNIVDRRDFPRGEAQRQVRIDGIEPAKKQ
ncbi:hypothetical protein CYMTET_13002 [Cymbomonas tetramitiformis]|uniref:Uncharacterized protein n=1 Tax=Cymbomonas tetramitiformis TaxID=36881 RepID=A0AAE0GIZ8_9CHLO|nr:hypothetical protein CYMTET_13002 [Cymbomonas tetramitiformis]